MIKLLELNRKTFNYYREELNGNKNDSYSVAKRKMTRNMMLAQKQPKIELKKGEKYCYGSLHFLVVNNNVVWIKNRCSKPTGWILDKSEYVELNEKLRIDGKSKNDLRKKDIKYFFKTNKSKLKRKLKTVFNK